MLDPDLMKDISDFVQRWWSGKEFTEHMTQTRLANWIKTLEPFRRIVNAPSLTGSRPETLTGSRPVALYQPTEHARTATNARLLDWSRHLRQKARASYWIMTPHKIPARIAFIRQLTSKNQQLLALNGEIAAKIEHQSKQIEQLGKQIEQQSKQIEQQRKRSAMDRPLAFMHVMKTSGVALRAGLREVLPSPEYIGGFDRGYFGAFRSFETMSPEIRQGIHEALPPANGIDFVTGHLAYSTLIRGLPAARFMTVLREPRSRILSLWMYWRSMSDEEVSLFGAWRRVIRLTRQPLIEFLNHPEAACQTDNVYVRMLLWPHPLIPDDGFIDSASDGRLASEAAGRLKTFDFADVIENPRLEDNVRAFLTRPFVYRRANETPLMPSELRVPLEEELTGEALLLLDHRSRLDRELWRAVAAERIAGAELTALSDDTFRRTVTRYAALMCPSSNRQGRRYTSQPVE